MRISPEQLQKNLTQHLAPVYLVSGEEPLQMIESTDAIRAQARAAGFAQRLVFEVGKDFEWQEFLAAGQSMSLFGDRQILDVRFSKSPDKAAKEALQSYMDNLSPDNLLLITLPKVDKKAQAQKWYAMLDKAGITLQVWPVKPHELGRWLDKRAQSVGLNLDREALVLLVERNEGNLLAAAQELDKLQLLYGQGRLTAQQVVAGAADSARYNVFDLVDTCFAGNRKKVVRMLEGLRAEGVATAQVMWWLVRDIRILAAVAGAARPGQNLDGLLSKSGVWDKRKTLFKKALSGRPSQHWMLLLQRCAELDCQVKGLGTGNVWEDLLELALALVPPASPGRARV